MPSNGYALNMHKQVDVTRMIIIFPQRKRVCDIYKPTDLNGSLNGLQSTNLDYPDTPTISDFEAIITNLENYENSDIIYESFEKEKYLLKYLMKTTNPVYLTEGTKVVTKDDLGDGYKSFVIRAETEMKSSSGSIIAVQYELTPLYLLEASDNIVKRIQTLTKDIEEGALVPEHVEDLLEEDTTPISEPLLDVNNRPIIPKSGGRYYE